MSTQVESTEKRKYATPTNMALFHHVRAITGLRTDECKLAIAAVMDGIREQIFSGNDFIIPKLGRFQFLIAKPRKVGPYSIGERPVLKFKPLDEVKLLVRTITPKKPRRYVRWSERKLANQNQTADGTASPSSQRGREIAARLKRGQNNRNPDLTRDKDGSAVTPDQTPGIPGIVPIVPAESPLAPYLRSGPEPARCEPSPTASPATSGLPPEAPAATP